MQCYGSRLGQEQRERARPQAPGHTAGGKTGCNNKVILYCYVSFHAAECCQRQGASSWQCRQEEGSAFRAGQEVNIWFLNMLLIYVDALFVQALDGKTNEQSQRD